VTRPKLAWFDEAECESVVVAGGKGASLARMTRAGLPVPEGFALHASVLGEALDDAGRREFVVELLGAGRPQAETAGDVVAVVRALSLPEALSREIGSALGRFGESAVAVRSSACAEDSETASFAGQQETYLNVRGADEVLARVRDCWASFFSERAIFYRSRKGSLLDLAMAVVVQRQVAAEKAGVMFTIDPVRRRRDQMIVEAVWGLGESLVSGQVTPDHYVLARDGTVKQARVAMKQIAVHPVAGGGTREERLDADAGGRRVLDDGELAQLAALGNRLQEHFGAPQDVEWAFAGGALHLLQSRPVTA
jgi:pyruvate,water dikinase